MRIAFFSEACAPQLNGVVTTQGKLIPYLRSRGHQVLFVLPRYKGNPQSLDVVEFKSLPFPLYPEMPVILPHWKFHMRKLEQVEAFQPDLVHLMTWGVLGFFGQKWARRKGIPVVASYETDIIRYLGYYGFGMFESQAWRYLRWLFNNCRRTYVPSPEIKKFLEGSGIRDVDVFERGVDCEQFHPAKRSELVRKSFGVEPNGVLVLYIGRLSKEKNLKLLLNSFIRLSCQYPKTRLVVTGDGPIRGSLTREFSHPSIRFTSWKRGEELCSLFASADIFVLPSTTETLSLVALESMASGVPVLAMNAGGVRDVVKHQETGLLADSAEEFDAFFRGMIADNSLCSKLGTNGRRYAECKTWTRAFQNLENSYLELLAGRHGAEPLGVATSQCAALK